MKVYVIEYLKDKSIFNAIQTFFTKSKYCHTAMFMDRTFCELDAINNYKNEPDYHLEKFIGIKDFLKNNIDAYRTEAYLIPHEFSGDEIEKGLTWWRKKESVKKWYGYTKLLSFVWLIPLRPFMRRYYRKHGIAYDIKTSSNKTDVCSIAVDKCLKIMGYDVFPEFDERTTYPGLYANKLEKYKVVI